MFFVVYCCESSPQRLRGNACSFWTGCHRYVYGSQKERSKYKGLLNNQNEIVAVCHWNGAAEGCTKRTVESKYVLFQHDNISVVNAIAQIKVMQEKLLALKRQKGSRWRNWRNKYVQRRVCLQKHSNIQYLSGFVCLIQYLHRSRSNAAFAVLNDQWWVIRLVCARPWTLLRIMFANWSEQDKRGCSASPERAVQFIVSDGPRRSYWFVKLFMCNIWHSRTAGRQQVIFFVHYWTAVMQWYVVLCITRGRAVLIQSGVEQHPEVCPGETP